MDKISLIIPCYNMENTLLRTLNSVREQDYKDLEIIIVDDGSTDSSLSILEQYAKIDSRFKILKSQHVGVAHARNLGLNNCTSKYVMFLNADDNYTSPYAISTMYKAIKRGFDADLCVCNFDSNYLNSFYTDRSFNLNKETDLKIFFQTDRTVVWNKLYKRSCITTLFNENLTFYEDGLFIYENLKNFKKVVAISPSFVNSTSQLTKYYNKSDINSLLNNFTEGEIANSVTSAIGSIKAKFDKLIIAKPKTDLSSTLWGYYSINMFFINYLLLANANYSQSKLIDYCKFSLETQNLNNIFFSKINSGLKFLNATNERIDLFVKLSHYAFEEIKTYNKNISTYLVANFIFAKIFFEKTAKLDQTDILTTIFSNNKLPEIEYVLNLFELNNLGLI